MHAANRWLILFSLGHTKTLNIVFTKHDKSLVEKTAANPTRRGAAARDYSKRRTFFFLVALFCVCLTCSVLFAGEQTPFEVFKSLQGQWSIRAGDKTLPFHVTYDLGSNGSMVTEQFGKELSVFYSDKGNLLMTHFCNRGNQPRLKLKRAMLPDAMNSICSTSPI
jgi:hypothetical protein